MMIVQRTAYGVQRLLLVAALLPIGGFAQLQLLQVNGTTETPVGASYDAAGSASPGDTLDIRFRIKNLGAASTSVQTIAVSGTGFKLSSSPLLPYTLATQAEVDFHVAFSPTGSGSFSATIALNTIVVTTIRATALPGSLLSFNGTTEMPVGATYDAGSVAPGDTLDMRFRIKNMGVGPTTVQTITLSSGTGFQLQQPLLPYILAPQAEVEFYVFFSPPGSGPFSATLAVNTIGVTKISATGAAPVALLSFGMAQLTTGSTADLGQIEIGTSVTKTFTLTNSNSAPVSIGSIAVTGVAFQGPIGIATPLQLAAGASAGFQVTFAPQLSGQARGTLTVDQRTFNLTGLGLVPPLPKGTIVVSRRRYPSRWRLHRRWREPARWRCNSSPRPACPMTPRFSSFRGRSIRRRLRSRLGIRTRNSLVNRISRSRLEPRLEASFSP